MSLFHSMAQGRRVQLAAPSLAFEGIDPPPVGIGDVGVVCEVKRTRTCHVVLVNWDNGITAKHDESELVLFHPGSCVGGS